MERDWRAVGREEEGKTEGRLIATVERVESEEQISERVEASLLSAERWEAAGADCFPSITTTYLRRAPSSSTVEMMEDLSPALERDLLDIAELTTAVRAGTFALARVSAQHDSSS